jgi:hypothetical protein
VVQGRTYRIQQLEGSEIQPAVSTKYTACIALAKAAALGASWFLARIEETPPANDAHTTLISLRFWELPVDAAKTSLPHLSGRFKTQRTKLHFCV